MKHAPLVPIANHHLLELAKSLKPRGLLLKDQNNYIYLNIDNSYIHDLFPLLDNPGVEIPNYFGDGKVGAHISLIYPEEYKSINVEDLHKEYTFEIEGLAQATLGHKTYYALMVNSPELLQVRRKYGLSDLLNFKGFKIGFHITLAVKPSPVLR